MESARGRSSTQYERQGSPKQSFAPESPTQKPLKLPAAPINVVDSQPVIVEDVFLETMDHYKSREKKRETRKDAAVSYITKAPYSGRLETTDTGNTH